MDATLHTQSASQSLSMKDIEIFSDGSGGVCNLEISSVPFGASVRFFFDYPKLDVFANDLAAIERSLSGEARLGCEYERPHVAFRGDGRGHVRVSGLLMDTTENMQTLEFSFLTDQTALGPFVACLREVKQSAR